MYFALRICVIFQVTIGKREKQPQEPQQKHLTIGDMCLLDVPMYAGEWPHVARVQDIRGQNVLIQWFKGSKTTPWQPCTKRAPAGGKWVPWTEEVDCSDIWCFGFELIMAQKLPQKIKEKIDNYCFL